ncbi:hypothetical protein KIW84_061354 [Lathyrus oleraceus]|uniref:Zinc knuckle CX2CX4HX4C domain-containing protein n=1 Tax=Pisum sativum TaxID=3888 RepID=A0A9D4W5C8_PEA|nr:hypothetical protein KIW84_061354 [Pisum sativum]
MVIGESCEVNENQSQHEEEMAERKRKRFVSRNIRGVLRIVDLSQDYYLVTFSSEEDHQTTLMEEQLAVCVRIARLSINYYNQKVLTFIGNVIKVDKNTFTRERGKYARLCIEVDLSKPLLAIFVIKGRHYKVEYEGLHLLCLSCGKSGHYAENYHDNNHDDQGKSGDLDI